MHAILDILFITEFQIFATITRLEMLRMTRLAQQGRDWVVTPKAFTQHIPVGRNTSVHTLCVFVSIFYTNHKKLYFFKFNFNFIKIISI